MSTEERFAQELGSCMESMDRINHVMNLSNMDKYDDIQYVMHAHKDATTFLVKVGHYYSTMSVNKRRSYSDIVSQFTQMYRKISRGLALWLFHREDVPLESTIFMLDDILGVEGLEVDLGEVFKPELSSNIYRDVTLEYDLVFRLCEMNDSQAAEQAISRIELLIEDIEILNDVINLRNYAPYEKQFLIASLVSMLKCIENMQSRLNRRLNND